MIPRLGLFGGGRGLHRHQLDEVGDRRHRAVHRFVELTVELDAFVQLDGPYGRTSLLGRASRPRGPSAGVDHRSRRAARPHRPRTLRRPRCQPTSGHPGATALAALRADGGTTAAAGGAVARSDTAGSPRPGDRAAAARGDGPASSATTRSCRLNRSSSAPSTFADRTMAPVATSTNHPVIRITSPSRW